MSRVPVSQELLGGCDIVLEMAADGELKEVRHTVVPSLYLQTCTCRLHCMVPS